MEQPDPLVVAVGVADLLEPEADGLRVGGGAAGADDAAEGVLEQVGAARPCCRCRPRPRRSTGVCWPRIPSMTVGSQRDPSWLTRRATTVADTTVNPNGPPVGSAECANVRRGRRSDRPLLQLATLALGQASPDAEALVVHQCVLEALVTHVARQADLLGLPAWIRPSRGRTPRDRSARTVRAPANPLPRRPRRGEVVLARHSPFRPGHPVRRPWSGRRAGCAPVLLPAPVSSTPDGACSTCGTAEEHCGNYTPVVRRKSTPICYRGKTTRMD